MNLRIVARLILLPLLTLTIAAAPRVTTLPIKKLVVLGDSLSDQGNLFAATSQLLPFGLPDAAHYYAGRFSNGGNYADALAGMLHLDLTPSLLGGTNFAFGGARTDYNVVELPPLSLPSGAFPWSLNGQRDAFLATANHNADPTTLYVVFSGSNDIGDILSLRLNPAATIAKTVNGIRDAILAFKAMGARTVLVPNVPNLGLTPLAAQFGVQGPLTALASAYNASLDAMLDGLTDINIIKFDSFAFVTYLVAHAADYGFTNVTQPCYTGFVVPDPTATECGDPDQYLFWDAEHPTSRFNALFAEEIFASALQCEESDKGHGPVKCAINAHTH
jgi:phospholipase/lecithinase/hemolysin